MSLIELTVPDIGDVSDAAVIELLVKPGDTIRPEQSLITIESDKASMEVPAAVGGVLKELRLKLGDKVSQGSIVGVLEVAEGAASASPADWRRCAASGSTSPDAPPCGGVITSAQVLAQAEDALRRAKGGGRNRVEEIVMPGGYSVP